MADPTPAPIDTVEELVRQKDAALLGARTAADAGWFCTAGQAFDLYRELRREIARRERHAYKAATIGDLVDAAQTLMGCVSRFRHFTDIDGACTCLAQSIEEVDFR